MPEKQFCELTGKIKAQCLRETERQRDRMTEKVDKGEKVDL